jgi:hypothetical protein
MALVVPYLPAGRTWTVRSPALAATLVGVAFALLSCCLLTFYRPVLTARMHIAAGKEWQQKGNFQQTRGAFEQAVIADPHSSEPRWYLVWLHHRAALAARSDAAIDAFEAAVAEAISKNPQSQSLRSQLGRLRLDLFHATDDARQLAAAIEDYSAAVRLYPNGNMGHAQLAWAYHLAAQHELAAQEAQEALRLDALNPHEEQKLANRRVYSPTSEPPVAENAEQLMFRLRK